MHYVYILRSVNFPEKIYVGYTNNIAQRLNQHNAGKSTYTDKYKPWVLHGYIAFIEETKAIAFEKYLKTGSGNALAKKHFL
jgi:predicted GIY-YIG superfamily endonuclease